ncbi:hypothetical protein [Clostridium sp. OS1-26]|nr:hypothetical protein [Clostridium sp. OS1-26]WML36139.1 hypothetical protein RCG18_05315 [Clostridium sp. OS1-26]
MKKKEIELKMYETFKNKDEDERKKILEGLIYKIIKSKEKSMN